MQILGQEARDELGIQLNSKQIAQFERYLALLLDWNQRVNLTAIREPEDIRQKHFLDGLSCARAFETSPENLVDIGSGAGFPGLPLKLLYPELALTLVDSVGKKTDFLKAVVAELELKDVTVIKARAEELGQDLRHRERYQWVSARGLAYLPVLIEYALPLVRVGGSALLQKGVNAAAEVQAAANAIQQMGGGTAELLAVELARLEPRSIIVVKKIKPTPKEYPRQVGVPARRPL
jgi:16S rRNA (guanine527-N7)-methyltransferase